MASIMVMGMREVLLFGVCALLTGAVACVPKGAVETATVSIETNLQVVEAAFAKCQEGEPRACDLVPKHLGAIRNVNGALAERSGK